MYLLNKNQGILLATFLMLFLSFLAVTAEAKREATKKDTHPMVTEQDKLMPCHECHKTSTPRVYQEWFESVHGIGNVKCYQCHGTFENMQRVPDVNRCAVCHAEAFGHSENKPCWQCHKAHRFQVSK
jgi:uncharacterized paraquat-inducible protein A